MEASYYGMNEGALMGKPVTDMIVEHMMDRLVDKMKERLEKSQDDFLKKVKEMVRSECCQMKDRLREITYTVALLKKDYTMRKDLAEKAKAKRLKKS